jgi:DNA adenine methylase
MNCCTSVLTFSSAGSLSLKTKALQTTAVQGVRVKPVLKWAGGKSGLLSQLLPLFPNKFSRYFEPFFGGGAVFFALGFSGECFLNDLNSELIELYETVRDEPDLLMKELDSLAESYSEEFYYQLRQQIPTLKIARAARTLFLNKVGFNGLYRQNSKGGFNVPFGKRKTCPALYEKENVLKASKLLKNATLQNKDFETLIDCAGSGDFVYCDPPYEPLSRTSSFNAYHGGGFSQAEQKRLKNACIRAHLRGATVVISNSSAEFIKDLYSDCEIVSISARRAINSKGHGRGKIEEIAVLFNEKETLFPVASAALERDQTFGV